MACNYFSLLCHAMILALLMQFQIFVVVSQPQVPCFFIFGDSLVDNGNNNGLVTMAKANYPPYGIDFPEGATGRFTDGKTFVDIIGEKLGFPEFTPSFATATDLDISTGVNYGSGGAGIRDESGSNLGGRFSLNMQLNNHDSTISTLKVLVGDDTLTNEYLKQCIYVVNMGANDYINNYLMPENFSTSRMFTPDQYAAVLVRQFSSQLTTLYKLGARKVAVYQIGLIGCAPAEIERFGANGTCVDSINDKVKLFNDRLKPLVDSFNNNFTDARFTYMNVTSITAPQGGVALPNDPCCQLRSDGQCIPNSTPCPNRDVKIWMDGYHTTQAVNSVIAARSYTKQSPNDASPFDISQLAAL